MQSIKACAQRKKAILELIKNYNVIDQTHMMQLLAKHYAIKTNQTAISRDIKNLGISKCKRGNQWNYTCPDVDIKIQILHLAKIDIIHNETTIIVKTIPGLADFIGDYLDEHAEKLSILGTIAGENMVFVAPKSVNNIIKTYKKILAIFDKHKAP